MNDKEGLNLLDFLPTGIDKSDPVIQAIFSNDDGEGAIADEIEELLAFIRYYTETNNVKNHRSYTLEMICRLFTKTIRQLEEDDPRLLRRMLALTVRGGDIIWGNAADIEHVFEAYFSGIKAYVCENTNAVSFFEDGDFEKDDAWVLTGNAQYTGDARFSGIRGLFFDGTPGSCSQTAADLVEGVYVLHFFLMGQCGVKIRDNLGRYWNAKAEADNYLLRWETAEVINHFESGTWKNVFCFIVLPDSGTLTVEFVSLDGKEASVDYARLFSKPLNPSYTVVVQYGGFKLSDKTLHLGTGTVDPIADIDYQQESYFDHAYIVGRQGAYKEVVYNSVLDIVRPRGIQAFIEFVEKTETEESA
jgi:hypothetical protein